MSGLIARLIAAGTPADLIEEVALLCARAQVDRDAIETRRAKDRDRQNARRNVTSRDIVDVTETTPALDKETSPRPPKEINPTPQRTTRTRETAHRLPEDWKPGKLDRTTVAGEIVEHRGQEWARRALESFRNHWHSANGPNSRKTKWQSAWANWILEQDRRDGSNGKRSANDPYDGLGITARAAISVFGAPERENPEPQVETLRRVGPSRSSAAAYPGIA